MFIVSCWAKLTSLYLVSLVLPKVDQDLVWPQWVWCNHVYHELHAPNCSSPLIACVKKPPPCQGQPWEIYQQKPQYGRESRSVFSLLTCAERWYMFERNVRKALHPPEFKGSFQKICLSNTQQKLLTAFIRFCNQFCSDCTFHWRILVYHWFWLILTDSSLCKFSKIHYVIKRSTFVSFSSVHNPKAITFAKIWIQWLINQPLGYACHLLTISVNIYINGVFTNVVS